jgi:hypothetical protein
MPDIILSQIPFADGNKTIIFRTEQPHQTTWENIFSFIEEQAKIPRKFISMGDESGHRISGKWLKYPKFTYEKYLLYTTNGKPTKAAFVSVYLHL